MEHNGHSFVRRNELVMHIARIAQVAEIVVHRRLRLLRCAGTRKELPKSNKARLTVVNRLHGNPNGFPFAIVTPEGLSRLSANGLTVMEYHSPDLEPFYRQLILSPA